MKLSIVSLIISAGLGVFAQNLFAQNLFAQNHGSGASASPVPVHMVVTAEPLRAAEMPPIAPADVRVFQDSTRLALTDWLPLQGDSAGLEFYVLIDERVDPNQAALFSQLRRFVFNQAPATAVGIAYMHNGEVQIAQAPTRDHAVAAHALRATSGNSSANANPFFSLSFLLNRWQIGETLRREVLLVTDGLDVFNDIGPYNMYLEDTIRDAQRAGVLVYCAYAPALGHSSHSPALIHGGQANLAQLAEETGGEAYIGEPQPPLSFEPYLADLAKHLANQYRLTFLATPSTGDGFQAVRIQAEVPNVEIISAHSFYLKTLEALP